MQLTPVPKHSTSPGRDSRDLPRVARPGITRSLKHFAIEAGEAMRHQRQWFNHLGQVAILSTGYRWASPPLGFAQINSWEAITALEDFILPGKMIRNRATGREEFITSSLDHASTAKLLKSRDFITRLPTVRRILDLPVPVAVADGSIDFPGLGYDKTFQTYCDPNAPEPQNVPLNKARAVLEEVHTDFHWQHDKSRIHALARMITPYCHGLMGWDARVPMWVFTGCMGKDYLASLTEVVYQGSFTNYFPSDMRSAIGAALRDGLRRMHVVHCHKRSALRALAEAVKNRTLKFKIKGEDVVWPNELELSVSGDFSVMVRDETIPLMRLIQIGVTDTLANQRRFKYPNLREKVCSNRAQVLGAIKALVDHWLEKGRPCGPSTFAGFPEWSRVVGGVMHVNGLGDPCLPHFEN